MATTISSGVNAFVPSQVGGTSTSALMFPALSGNFTAAGVTTPGGASITSALVCSVPANGQYEQQIINVKAAGKLFVHGTSPTVLFKMYNGSSLTAASNTAILSMSAASLTTNAWYPWAWQSVFQGDSSSGMLQAVSSTLWINNATAGSITLTGISSGVSFISAGPGNIFGPGYTTTSSNNAALNFSISCTFAVSDALNKAFCSQFCVVTD